MRDLSNRASKNAWKSTPTASNRTCHIVATLTTNSWMERPVLPALGAISAGLEIRADLIGELRPDILRGQVDGELTYSLRSAEYGGVFTGDRKSVV